MPDFYSLRVQKVHRETPNAVVVSFDIPKDLTETFRFKAGQYITLKHPENGKVRRAYSICSRPGEALVQVGIKKVDGGLFSVYANEQIQAGDVLEVMPPEGRFVFDPVPNATNNYLAFAAGSGITPVLSIIKEALTSESDSSFVLVYGNQSVQETMFYGELLELLEQFPSRLHIEFVFSREQVKNALFGRIEKALVNYLLKNKYANTPFTRYYLCGPEGMINEVRDTLTNRGVAADHILFELFTTSVENTPNDSLKDGETQITVTVDEETQTFIMSQKKTVLESVLAQDIDAPYSCQGGVCSSCIARVIEGTVEMVKNQILTDSEVEDGLVLTCQSHPTTTTLTVDYDDV